MDLKRQLIRFEGVVPHAYPDHMGWLSIGVGRLIDVRKGGGLSPDEIDYLLENDIRRTRTGVFEALPWATGLNEPRQAVLIGMAFQLGVGGMLKFKNTLAYVRDARYAEAAQGMKKSLWAKQTPERVRILAEQMASGEWQEE